MNNYTIFIVDDDALICNTLKAFMDEWAYESRIYTSAFDFIKDVTKDDTGCILLDLDMPDMDGLELQQELNNLEINMPVIFLSGYGDIPSSVKAIKQGALNFLQKPFHKDALLAEIDNALLYEHERLLEKNKNHEAQLLYNTLSKREKEVFCMVVRGYTSDCISRELFISLNTVKKHRKSIIKKLNFTNIAEMTLFASEYNLC